jgi:hypothetical protein
MVLFYRTSPKLCNLLLIELQSLRDRSRTVVEARHLSYLNSASLSEVSGSITIPSNWHLGNLLGRQSCVTYASSIIRKAHGPSELYWITSKSDPLQGTAIIGANANCKTGSSVHHMMLYKSALCDVDYRNSSELLQTETTSRTQLSYSSYDCFLC